MEKKNRKEELQSRREFFKKAAKSALPILGAIVLASAPTIVNAAEKTPMGCQFGCKSMCTGTCWGSCQTGCKTGCKHGCTKTCGMTCKGGNYGY